MRKEEILNRLEQIISISKEKINVPPVHLVLAIDGNLIDQELYDEYESLIKLKIDNHFYTKSEESKLEQLSYIKDKLKFFENKAKKSKNSISILPDDISDYSDALNLYNDLSSELSYILKNNSSLINSDSSLNNSLDIPSDNISNQTLVSNSSSLPNDILTSDDNIVSSLDTDAISSSVEHSISLASSPKPSISLDISSNNNNNNNKNLLSVLDIPSSNQKLLSDLADIDKILDNLSFSNPSINNSDAIPYDESTPLNSFSSSDHFFIGSVVSPSSDVPSYNDSSIIASKDSFYRIISFVALDSNDNVIDSSNTLGLSFEDFSNLHSSSNVLFILASPPNSDVDFNDWVTSPISSDFSCCLGSFSSLSSFSSLASPPSS